MVQQTHTHAHSYCLYGLKHAGMTGLGRKRVLSEAEKRNLRRCLSVPGVSEEQTRQIWNIASELRQDAREASKRQLYNVVDDRLKLARACFLNRKVETEDGTDADLILLDLKESLKMMVQRCPAWGNALQEAYSAAGGWLTLVTYHDEIVCGNVLAVLKRKKYSAFYISFKEMRWHLRLEQAWLPAMTLPRELIDKVAGGLSGAVKVFIKAVYETSSDFTLEINGQQRRFKLRGHSHLLSDHDAQRATFQSKGSAALKPCLFCANVCKKETVSAGSENFYGIESAKWDNFVPVKARHWTYAVNHLTACHTQKEVDKWEKVYGLNRNENSIMFDAEARALMNPTDALNDALHCYYCNGVASAEIFLFMEAAATYGMDRHFLQTDALALQWFKQGMTRKASENFVVRLFKEKMLEGPLYKGDAKETKPLVYLLAYYATLLREEQLDAKTLCDSFLALKNCCQEMQQLYIRPKSITAGDEVKHFHDAQIRHQELFILAHGAAATRPKHHHRLHLPSHALLFGDLPECSLQEKKHQILKSGGLADRQEGKLSNHKQLQQALCSRMLETVAEAAANRGMAKWGLDNPIKKAPPALCQQFQSNDLYTADSATLRIIHVRRDSILFCNESAVLIHTCLFSPQVGLFFHISRLELIKLYPWGSAWKRLEQREKEILLAKQTRLYNTPMWWREVNNDQFHLMH